MTRGFFVTGTDTGIGKTLISCALLHAFAGSGARAIGMKPVAAGCRETPYGTESEDVAQLRAASSVHAPDELVAPYAFAPAIAPHIGARQAGVEIELARIHSAYLELSRRADVVIVEGVGGFRVPLNAREDTADLAVLLALPIILVVGMRLGCLNHALLTVEAIRTRKLELAGWIANQIQPEMEAFDQNVAALEERICAPRLATIPFQVSLDPAQLASLLAPLPGSLACNALARV